MKNEGKFQFCKTRIAVGLLALMLCTPALSLGWGAGVIGKSAWLDTANQDYRQILKSVALYNSALASGLPFPKTRHIVFMNDQPASVPGWARLEILPG